MAAAAVAELVEVPLAVPFDAFLSEHNSVFLPVLLRQPGIVSVKTGEPSPELWRTASVVPR